MKVLGIETSCDETAVALVEDGYRILSNHIASQTDIHTLYGGVVPELASRRHSELILPMIDQTLKQAELSLSDIDLIAATHSPGLLGALLVGLQTAKSLAIGLGKPFVGVHHIEAHLYSAWMSQEGHEMEDCLPALGVAISGGHTLVVLMHKLGQYELLSHTLDDALGEAFDKVAVMLGLPYPGGPYIEKLAKQGDPKRYPFKAPHSKKHPWHFSYSGLKTQVLYAIWGPNLQAMNDGRQSANLSDDQKADLAASFQHTVIEDLCHKLGYWVQQTGARSIWIGGGVSANRTLRHSLAERIHCPIFWPTRELSVDNGAMIAGLAYHQYKATGSSSWMLEAIPRSPLPNWG